MISAKRTIVNSPLIGWLGACLILAGMFIYVRAGMQAGVDFNLFYYPAGTRYAQGLNPYVLDGDPLQIAAAARGEIKLMTLGAYAGSPTTCALFAPFATFPLKAAKFAWLLLTLSGFSVGVWLAMGVILPDWTRSLRLLLLGITICAASLRWNGGQAQIEPLVAGAFGVLLYGTLRSKNGVALLGGVLTFLKWNSFPPLFCLLLLLRRFRLLTGILLLAALIDVVAAARVGVREMYAGNLLALRAFLVPGTSNYPNAHQLMAALHGDSHPIYLMPGVSNQMTFRTAGDFLHWVYLFSAFTPTMEQANTLALVCSLIAFAGLGWLAWKAGARRREEEFILRFFGASVCLGLLCISHLKYDAVMLVYPFFLTLRQMRSRPAPEVVILFVTCFIMGFAIAGSALRAWWLPYVVLPGNHIWLVPIYSYLTTAAFAAAFVNTWRYTARNPDLEQVAS